MVEPEKIPFQMMRAAILDPTRRGGSTSQSGMVWQTHTHTHEQRYYAVRAAPVSALNLARHRVRHRDLTPIVARMQIAGAGEPSGTDRRPADGVIYQRGSSGRPGTFRRVTTQPRPL